MYVEDTTQNYQLFSAYQSFLREQILFSPSEQYQKDPRLRIYAVTLQQIVTSNVRIKKKHVNWKEMQIYTSYISGLK